MYSQEIYLSATTLRKKGKSYAEITSALGIPKSTLAGWFKGKPYADLAKADNISRQKVIWGKNIRAFNK
jgi:transcriptional regulator with XRE-family HTH domain